MTDFIAARLNMVESQVRPNGITDRRIIAAIEQVPRESFVPESRRAIAYMDEDVPLDPSDKAQGPRALIEVMAFARMLQHAMVKPGDKVLVVGAGSGYGAAVIAQLAARVVALECDPGLAGQARRNLAGVANATVVEGALSAGVPGEQPFDVIVAEGRVEEVPPALLAQLSDEGRLVAVVGESEMAQACIYTRSGSTMAVRQVFDASVAALPGLRKKKPAFVF
ncbi:MAG: protein-L-isoaspartate O-methyltransferase [Aestuariivirga sp.]|nr:protein-L-isoaspartate O-methyltransferase [Aestuariivirga sp.]